MYPIIVEILSKIWYNFYMSEKFDINADQSAESEIISPLTRKEKQIKTGKISPVDGFEDIVSQLHSLPKNIVLSEPNRTAEKVLIESHTKS